MPSSYIAMNHVGTGRITIAAIILAFIIEYSYILWKYKTICTKHNIYNLQTFNGFILDKDKMNMKPATLIYHMAIILVPWLLDKIGRSLKKRVSRRVMNFPNEAISQVQRNIRQIRNMSFVDMKDESSMVVTAMKNDLKLVDLDHLNERRQQGMKGHEISKEPVKISISKGKSTRANTQVQNNRNDVEDHNDIKVIDLDALNERRRIGESVTALESSKEQEKPSISQMKIGIRDNHKVQKKRAKQGVINKAFFDNFSEKDNDIDPQAIDENTTEENKTDTKDVINTVAMIHNENTKKEEESGIKHTINTNTFFKAIQVDKKETIKRSTSLYFLQAEKQMKRKSSLIFLQETKQSLGSQTQLNIPSQLETVTDKKKIFKARKVSLMPRGNTPIGIRIDSASNFCGPEPTLKPQLIKIGITVWVGILILALALYTVFINPKNNIIILIHGIVGKLFFQVLAPYWILRSEEKIKFVQRRFNRLID